MTLVPVQVSRLYFFCGVFKFDYASEEPIVIMQAVTAGGSGCAAAEVRLTQ